MTADNMEEDIISEINLTPLVDVSLVLVIIFMVVAPFVTHILKPLQLPHCVNASLSEQNSIKVSVFPDGTLAVGPNLVKREQLESALQQEIASGKNPWVMLRAGMMVSHGRVMDIVGAIKKAGIKRIGFAAKPKAPAKGQTTDSNITKDPAKSVEAERKK